MIESALSRPWIDNWMAEHAGKRPTVIIGTVKNDTGDYIDTKLFTKQLERELINSGRVQIVAGRDERGIVALPGSLGEAAEELAGSELMARALGEHIFPRYVELKRREWNEYRIQVTEWEKERYLSAL